MTYFKRYKNNKEKCGAKKKTFTTNQLQYIKERVADGWTPDVIKKSVENKEVNETLTIVKKIIRHLKVNSVT